MTFARWTELLVECLHGLLRKYDKNPAIIEKYYSYELPLIRALYDLDEPPEMVALYICEHFVDRHLGYKRAQYTYEILPTPTSSSVLYIEMADKALAYRWVKIEEKQ